jgi:hypothetical protein
METKAIQASFALNSAKFFENYVNITHCLLGYTLKPFCLLHLLWLENIGSPFFNTSEKLTFADLEIAVLICSSSSSEEIFSKLNAKGWLRTLRKRFWHARNERLDLREAVLRFVAYQDDYTSLPDYGETEKAENRAEALPSFLVQAAALIKETGWTQEAVFALPLGQIIWLNAAFAYLATGKTSVISDKEQAATVALAELTKGSG